MKKITLLLSAMLMTVMSFAGVVTFDADTDQGNATTDYNKAAAYQIVKEGITLDVTKGCLGTYNNEMHYRAYKNEKLTITSTAGAITSIQFTCTGKDTQQYGPGNFTVEGGKYTYSGEVGTWAGSATEVTFSAAAQVRTSQIVVAIDGAEIPGGGDGGGTTPPTPPTPPVDPGKTTIEIPAEAQGWNIPAEAIDVLQARAICAGLEAGATTGTKYYVMGYVKKIHNKHADGVANYGNAQFYMENVNGANSEEDFMAYQVYGLNGEKITDPNVVAVGDFVVVYGELTNYMGNTYETVGKGAAYIWNSTNPLIAGDPNVVNVEGMQYADASYYTEDEIGYFDFDMYVDVDPDTYEYTYPELYVTIKANSKTALNGTYDLLGACLWTSVNDSIEMGEALGTVTIKNVDTEGNYSFKGSFVGADGKTYKFNDEMYVWGFDYDTEEEIVFSEESTGPVTPPTPPTGGAIVFDASVDQGDAPIYAEGVSGAQYTVTKNNVTLTVSSGVIGTANSLTAYRIYKGSTLTVSSSAGNIKSIVFTCTAENDAKQGPGCFTVDGGDYTYAGTVGTWTGDAATITFTASTNQVRATQIVVTLANATAVEDVTVGATPVKVIENGQVLIIRGEHIYNVLGAQVK